MKILLLVISLIIFNVANAEGNFAFDISEKEGVQLISGERSIAIRRTSGPDLSKSLAKNVHNDMQLKFRLIGLEFANYEWSSPHLEVGYSIIDMGDGYYSGLVSLDLFMPATLDKGGIRSKLNVWHDSQLFANAKDRDIREYFKDMTDAFLNDYLKANPRKYTN